jgi:nicotinamide-nucleotide amidase
MLSDMQDLVQALTRRALTVAVAEGDTGGLLLAWLIAVPGSSAVVRGGVVAYHDDLKRSVLGVDAGLLREHGAVSAAVAEAMAVGVRRVAVADVGVATTGIAGPGGARPGKPVGLAYVAIARTAGTFVRRYQWQGDRAENQRASAHAAAACLREVLLEDPQKA